MSDDSFRLFPTPPDPIVYEEGGAGRSIRFDARSMAWVAVLACAVFVTGGLWMAVFAATSKDRWTGLARVVFFGACGSDSCHRDDATADPRPALAIS